MPQEILYTSAEQGLKPGSHGFCTVAGTSGMAINLAQRLESLTAYRHVFPAQSGPSSQNPVAYSHIRLDVAGRRYQVLSRICDAGLDYTQRTNKFAHLVALESNELPACGPARLAMHSGFLESAWDGKVQPLHLPRKVPNPPATNSGAQLWGQVMGDSGWAGQLAETVLNGRQAILLFTPEMDLLALYAEALDLLPEKKRWEASFSTYFTRAPVGIACQWRGLLAGTPEAQGVRSTADCLVIDLTKPYMADNSPASLAARNGEPLQILAEQPTTPRVLTREAITPQKAGKRGRQDSEYTLLDDIPPAVTESFEFDDRPPRKQRGFPVVLVAVLLCIIFGGATITTLALTNKKPTSTAAPSDAPSTEKEGEEEVHPPTFALPTHAISPSSRTPVYPDSVPQTTPESPSAEPPPQPPAENSPQVIEAPIHQDAPPKAEQPPSLINWSAVNISDELPISTDLFNFIDSSTKVNVPLFAKTVDTLQFIRLNTNDSQIVVKPLGQLHKVSRTGLADSVELFSINTNDWTLVVSKTETFDKYKDELSRAYLTCKNGQTEIPVPLYSCASIQLDHSPPSANEFELHVQFDEFFRDRLAGKEFRLSIEVKAEGGSSKSLILALPEREAMQWLDGTPFIAGVPLEMEITLVPPRKVVDTRTKKIDYEDGVIKIANRLRLSDENLNTLKQLEINVSDRESIEKKRIEDIKKDLKAKNITEEESINKTLNSASKALVQLNHPLKRIQLDWVRKHKPPKGEEIEFYTKLLDVTFKDPGATRQ